MTKTTTKTTTDKYAEADSFAEALERLFLDKFPNALVVNCIASDHFDIEPYVDFAVAIVFTDSPRIGRIYGQYCGALYKKYITATALLADSHKRIHAKGRRIRSKVWGQTMEEAILNLINDIKESIVYKLPKE